MSSITAPTIKTNQDVDKIEQIKSLISSVDLSIRYRSSEQLLWEKTLSLCSYIPFSYTNTRLDYQWICQSGHGGEWQDISLIIFWDNKPAALWPLSFSIRDGRHTLSSYESPVLPPLFRADCPLSSRKRIVKSCLDLADSIAKIVGLDSWESEEIFYDSLGLSAWYAEAMVRGSAASIYHELFLDLQLDMPAIKRNFRKSYKSLISSGMRIWTLGLLDFADDTVWAEYRDLHYKAAGRRTRSDNTWELQLKDIADKNAFLVYLRNEVGQMVGGGLFHITRDEGCYSVGAYDRALFDKPLGHVVQYRAIEELKSRGIRWYNIGSRPYPSDCPAPTDKEIRIGEFKQGFASHLLPKYRLRHAVF